MRVNPTEAEDALWQQLRGGRFGVRYRRQHAIGRFIVDFVCIKAMLIVEVDGKIHETNAAADRERDAWLASAGFRVFRIPNERILNHLDAVVHDIARILHDRLAGTVPSPPGEGTATP